MIRFSSSRSVSACRLTSYDLQELIAIMLDGFTPEDAQENFSISTNFDNREVRTKSSKEFLQQKLPASLSNLSIMTGGSGKHVWVWLGDSFCRVECSSDNETWVLGKAEQVISYLNGKRPWYWFIKSMISSKVYWACICSIFAHLVRARRPDDRRGCRHQRRRGIRARSSPGGADNGGVGAPGVPRRW